jgi:hypothetical protein
MFIPLRFNEFWTKSKQIQNVSMYIYWPANFLSDIVLLSIVCLYTVSLAMILDKRDYFTAGEYGEIRILHLG